MVRVSADRVTRAPTRPNPSTATSTPATPSDPVITPPAREKDAVPRKSKPPRRVMFALPEFIPDPGPIEKEYVVDRLVDAQMNYMGQILYQVRCLAMILLRILGKKKRTTSPLHSPLLAH
jgi:hypothetical protein